MLGTAIHLHLRPDASIKVNRVPRQDGTSFPTLDLGEGRDTVVSIFPGLDGLRRLNAAIAAYLAEHDSTPCLFAPPLAAEASTGSEEPDADLLPPGWVETETSGLYEHESGDWVDFTHSNGKARAMTIGGVYVGWFAMPRQAMEALDARRTADRRDIMSSPVPDSIAAEYGQPTASDHASARALGEGF